MKAINFSIPALAVILGSTQQRSPSKTGPQTKEYDVRKLFLILGGLALMPFGTSVAKGSPGKILVVVSSENVLQLQDGKTYSTGYYLNELTVPVRALVDAGYEVTFANPKGNTPAMDAHSDSAAFFGNDQKNYQSYKAFNDSLDGLRHPEKLSDVVPKLDQFDGVFFPGGHAPMVDLLKSPDVGKVLAYFHQSGKPTALICHGPISLLAALPTAPDYTAALAAQNYPKAGGLAKGWAYAGYHMTIFSTAEEKIAETNGQLKGRVLFYPDVALETAGGNVQVAPPWKSNVVRDRELITGQNPYSDEKLATVLLAALQERK
jgi:putative intracellular protease/amidase